MGRGRAATARAGRPGPAKPQLPPEILAARPDTGRRRPVAPPDLARNRRTLPDDERLEAPEPRRLEDLDERQLLSARTGHAEMQQRLRLHTESSPELSAGDVDARWEDAYSTGDEAPGGDNPTPDQDRVEDIGRALGINYADDQELQGGAEVEERDHHRWELDPASADDWPRRKDE